MKRDIDLVRKLLLYVEDKTGTNTLDSTTLSVQGHDRLEVGYHIRLLADAGLLNYIDGSAMGDDVPNYLIEGLTWRGHDFVDSIRDNTVWKRTKEALKPVGAVSIEVIASVATKIIKEIAGVA